jgi:hypothetical protein
MSTVIGLGVQFSANANGMTKGLSQVDRQLQNLGKQAAAAASLFDGFSSSSGAAAAAQQQFATDIGSLTNAYQASQISAQEYASQLQAITAEARTAAAAFAEGARITDQVATAEERRTAELERLGQLLAQGAISEETYSRAAAEASGANEEAAKAETERAKALSRAAQITQANLSPQQKYDAAVQELSDHLAAGRISQETYNSALAKATTDYERATRSATAFEDASAASGDSGKGKFEGLLGVLSGLPGPIGNVGNLLSGLSSAGQGLGRIFGGGDGPAGGLANVADAAAGLPNPLNLGLDALNYFAQGAVEVASRLVELESRVETLGNLADQLGVSFEFVQVLEEAGNRSGVSIETLASSMTRLQKTLAGADEESASAQKALGRLGVAVEELNGLSQQDQIRLIGDRLQAIEDPAQRTAAAVALFGKSGAGLLPFFKNLSPAASDLERFGKVLNDIDRGRIDDFGAGVDALRVASKGLSTDLLLPFAGLGEGIAQGSAEFLGGINAIVGPIGDVLEPMLSRLGTTFEIVGVILGGIGRSIGALLAPVGDLAQAWGGLTGGFDDGLVDVVRYFVDAEVAAREWLASFSPLNAITDGIGGLGETISRISNIIGTALSQVGGYIGETLESWAEFFDLQSAIEQIGGVISSVFGSVSSTFQTIATAIGGTVGRLLTIAENFLGITAEVDTTITPELDLTQPSLAAAQFAKDIGTAATAAAEFGEAGFQAALAYQESLEQIAQLQSDNTLTAEEAKKMAEQEKAAFEAKIETLDQEAQAQAKAAEAAQKAADEKIAAAERAAAAAVEADRRLADAFISAQGLGGDGATAADTLLAITRQIEETEAAIVEARASGDKAAEDAAIRRLQVLDQAQAAAEETAQFGFSTQDAERAIASVRDSLDETFSFENFEIAPEAFAAAQEQLSQLEADLEAKVIDPETFEQAADAIRKGFEDALATAQKIADLNEQYANRAAEIEADRLDALSQVSQQPVQATDVRTSEGVSEFLRLATGREDPAIAEYRKQLSELQKIKAEIGKLGGVVDIVGAA